MQRLTIARSKWSRGKYTTPRILQHWWGLQRLTCLGPRFWPPFWTDNALRLSTVAQGNHLTWFLWPFCSVNQSQKPIRKTALGSWNKCKAPHLCWAPWPPLGTPSHRHPWMIPGSEGWGCHPPGCRLFIHNLLGGAGESRTPVQTRPHRSFYMFISRLIVGWGLTTSSPPHSVVQ